GPISPIRSVSETVKETSSKSAFAPNAFEMFCPLMIGGNGCGPPAILRLSRNAAYALTERVRSGSFRGKALNCHFYLHERSLSGCNEKRPTTGACHDHRLMGWRIGFFRLRNARFADQSRGN